MARGWGGAPAPERVNRWGLALLGGCCLAGGLTAGAAGAGVFGPALAGSPLLGGATARFLEQSWSPYLLVAVASFLAFLAARWLRLQGRSDAVGRLRVEPPAPSGATELSTNAVHDVFEGEVIEYHGVHKARVRVTESNRDPHLRVDLTLDEGADVGAVWRRVRSEAINRLRSALELDRLPTVVRVSTPARPANPTQELV